MRIRRLDLLRYGRFTGVSLELPRREPDIHILFGPNEAGKSTTLSAIEEMLFGIAPQSPLNFVHDYSSMRVGAVLEMEGRSLEFRRRKGKKDTLLGADDAPLQSGEAALAPFLAGADRQFFARMFSLDYERLRQGGREIIEARDEAGQTLFSAGAGLAGLRERLNELDEEADALWGSRRAARRKYSQAEDRLKAAEAALREHTVTANKWQELRRAHEAACEAYDAIEGEIERMSAEQRKLSRIRRVYRNVSRKLELDAQAAALGPAVLLPQDARPKLEAAERDDANAGARIDALAEQLTAEREARAGLVCDGSIIARAEDIGRLHELRIQTRKAKAELPRLLAELESAEASLRRLAGELGWEPAGDIEQLAARIPSRIKAAGARTLLNRRGELVSAADNAQAAVEEADARSQELRQRLETSGAPVDASMLAAAVADCREHGDLALQIRAATAEAEAARAAAERRLEGIRPAAGSTEELGSASPPPRETVQRHRDSRRELDQRMGACRERLALANQELARRRKAWQRLASDGKAVSPEELKEARRRRDRGWSLVRRRWLDGDAVSDQEARDYIGADGDQSGGSLPDAFEKAMRDADATADRRFDGAAAAARLAEISSQIAEQEDSIEGLAEEEGRLAKEGADFDLAWWEMWAGAGIEPLSPDAMLEWMTARTETLALVERRLEAAGRADALRLAESLARDRLLAELAATVSAVGGESEAPASRWEDQPLRLVVEHAAGFLRRCEKAAEDKRLLEESLARSVSEAQAKRRALEKARLAWFDWEAKWSAALEGLGLSALAGIDAAAARLDALDEMRGLAATAADLRRKRLAGIERDAAAFEQETAGVVSAITPDLAEAQPEAAVLTLESRLAEAERTRGIMAEKDEAIASLEARIKDCETSRREARLVISDLQQRAGVDDVQALKLAVARSDSLRELQAAIAQTAEALIQDGDGLPLAELQEACANADLDQIAAREEALDGELRDLRERLMASQQQRVQARAAFEAIGGTDGAARAAADRQAALVDMAGAAAHYIRARSAALLLRWAIDRYRKEKQAPLLQRAGACFAVLTNGSFAGLQLEFDDRDNARLTGVRPDGTRVGVGGMSAGTADQLYLALRTASVEDYLGRAQPLPFVADDLFINFDDERSGAGFEVLGRLAEKTQVVFFTHHWRLVEIARSRLGESVSVATLER